jgi:hypothetical protein
MKEKSVSLSHPEGESLKYPWDRRPGGEKALSCLCLQSCPISKLQYVKCPYSTGMTAFYGSDFKKEK